MSEAAPDRGVTFPRVDGRRSSAVTGRAVLADAARPVDPALAARVVAEQRWRTAYAGHLRDLLVASLGTPGGAVAAAEAGLRSVAERFVVAGPRGDMPLGAAVAGAPAEALGTAVLEGTGPRERELTLPYHGRRLRRDDVHRRLDDWVARGVLEPSAAEAVTVVAANPDWLDLSDRAVVLLGAGAEMAPLHPLARWGATVHAVDVPSPPVWRRILAVARGGAGRLVLPVRGETADLADGAGADLVTQTAAVREWLARIEAPMVLGNYGYADGAAFVRLSVAIDALAVALRAERPDTALAMLATPTDVFAVPVEAVDAARDRWAGRGWRAPPQAAARAVTRGRAFTPHYPRTVRLPDGDEVGVADAIVLQQGPNYALAKQLQRWRALATWVAGAPVSANVAPPTRTRSVTRNRLLAAAYSGAGWFGIEVFAPETAATLMAALLVHDLRRPPPPGRPHELFTRGAAHGGLWRVPYAPRSVLPLAALAGAPGLVAGRRGHATPAGS